MVPKANDDGDLISLLMANLSPVFLCIGRKLRFLKKLFDVDCIVLKWIIYCKLTNMGSKANINIPKTFKIVHWVNSNVALLYKIAVYYGFLESGGSSSSQLAKHQKCRRKLPSCPIIIEGVRTPPNQIASCL